MANPSDLYTALVSLLSVCVSALNTTAAGAPPMTAVYPGQPPIDCCPMLAVWWTPITQPPAGQAGAALDAYHHNRTWLNLVTFHVASLRCDARIPDGSGMPSVVDINSAAKQVADDAWALNSFVRRRILDGTLLGPYPCNEIAIGPFEQLSPAGGAVGVTFALQAVLQGYDS